jgi:Domain of unknown function (DUF4352)
VTDPTRAEDQPQAWVGRATPRPAPPSPLAPDHTEAPVYPPYGADPYAPYVPGPHASGPYVPGPYVPGPHMPGQYAPGLPNAGLPGAPVRRRTGRTTLLVIAGILAACCAGAATLAIVANAAWRSTTSSVGQAPPGLNSAVRDGKFEFVVTSFSCGHASVGRGFIVTNAQGQFCIADLTVRNISEDRQTFSDVHQKAIDPAGTIYGADTGAGFVANENGRAAFALINPGNEITAKIVFDIAKDATVAKLELHDSPLSGGVSVIL